MKRIKKNIGAKLNQDTEFRRDILYKVLANSITHSRASYGNTQTFNGMRDVYEALGYPQIDRLEYKDYYAKYRRQDISAAIINKPVYGSWKKAPIVRTSGEEKRESDPFRDKWEELVKQFKLYSIFQRADILAGIGRYSTIYIGVGDEQVEVSQAIGNSEKLLYLQPYSEDNSPIKTIDYDVTSDRYGLPAIYGLRNVQIEGGQVQAGTYNEHNIHHSRVIHIADNLLENNIYGIPRLEKVFNRLLNLELIIGGSAEMFWQGAFPGLAFNVQEGYELDADDFAALDQEIKKYVHNLERYMKLNGVDASTLSSSVADPSNHVEVQLKMISIATNIPKRILEGSERGELASSQDTKAWNEYCDNRRRTHNEDSILRPTIDKFIEIGILPDPGEYEIEWPDLETTSDKEKADVGKIRAEAIKSYSTSPESQYIVTPKLFLEEILDLDPEKVERILEESEKNMGNILGMEEEADETEEEDIELIEEES